MKKYKEEQARIAREEEERKKAEEEAEKKRLADIEAEKLIQEYLLSKSDIPILGEETGASVSNLGKTFCSICS